MFPPVSASTGSLAKRMLCLLAGLQVSHTVFAGEVVQLDDCRVTANATVTLSAERLGILRQVNVREGNEVSQNALIAQLKDDAARQLLATSVREADNDIDLRYAQKLSELSTLEYTNARTLNEEIPGAKSQAEVLRLRLAAQRATLQVEQASHQLDLAAMRKQEAEVALESYQVRAPISGVVLRVHKRVGEAVQAGDPIAEVANFDRMRVEGVLPAQLSWRVQPDQPVRVRISGLESVPELHHQTFSGVITFVDPIISELSQQVRVWAEIENRDGLLKDGLTASMEIDLDRQTPAPTTGQSQAAQNRPVSRRPGFTSAPR